MSHTSGNLECVAAPGKPWLRIEAFDQDELVDDYRSCLASP